MRKLIVGLILAVAVAGCRDGGIDNPTDPSQVNIEFSFSDLSVGTGTAQAGPGNSASINYSLWLYDPNGVASKGVHKQTSTYTFTIGTNSAITGVDQGIRGMRVGGSRRVYIPSSMGYGSSGTPDGSIPPNAALVFEMTLTALQ